MRKYRRASRALDYAERQGAPGIDIARFGRRLGARLLRAGTTVGVPYLLTPINITRYFEFDFVLRNLRPDSAKCLDVSSTRLFGLYVADQRPIVSLRMLNPDVGDAELTRAIARRQRWADMPGFGVCAFVIDKPAGSDQGRAP